MFLQRETYVNRKIPLNGFLNVQIGSLKNLKAGINNIQYLTSLNKDPELNESIHDRTVTSVRLGKQVDSREAVDKHRALANIMRDGLNLGVQISLFDESPALKEKFGTQESRVILKTLSPIFDDEFEFKLKMDTDIFEYLKTKRAIFEVRHYFTEDEQTFLKLGQSMVEDSEASSDFDTKERDFITLGYAKVPLINLLTQSTGFSGEIQVLDDFSQHLGSLELGLSLNHQSRKRRPVVQRSDNHEITNDLQRMTLIDTKKDNSDLLANDYVLSFSFIELVTRRKRSPYIPEHPQQRMTLYLRFTYLSK